MWPNPQKTADLVAFTEEAFNGKLHFLCSDDYSLQHTTCKFPDKYEGKAYIGEYSVILNWPTISSIWSRDLF